MPYLLALALRTLTLLQARSARRPPPRRAANGRGRPSSPVRRTLFHAPSFSAGVVMGAAVVLGAAYLPELLGGENPAEPTAPAAAAPEPELTFEFDDLLRNSRVTADPDIYATDPEPAAAADEEILLQAASFRSREDAERLRAALLLMDLPATTSSITLSSGLWYRVTVGPFERKVEAERALTRLREKNIAAIWTRRPK
ncbi:MAG TPA: SPOR domain-containing protein [Pseudomonadales bacterium]